MLILSYGVRMHLEKLYPLIKNRARIIIILTLFLILTLFYYRFVKISIYVIAFIIVGGLSKFYHRFLKSTIGIDLVLFTTIMTALVYKSVILSLIVGWLGLVIADTIGSRFSYTSFVSLIGLASVSIVSQLIISLPIIAGAIILIIIFEIISAIFYVLMGSSPQKITVFLVSHLLFNVFMILNFATGLQNLML